MFIWGFVRPWIWSDADSLSNFAAKKICYGLKENSIVGIVADGRVGLL